MLDKSRVTKFSLLNAAAIFGLVIADTALNHDEAGWDIYAGLIIAIFLAFFCFFWALFTGYIFLLLQKRQGHVSLTLTLFSMSLPLLFGSLVIFAAETV